MKKQLSIICSAITIALLSIAGIECDAENAKTIIRVRGADSVAGRVEKITKMFLKENPDYNIIVSGGAKGIGLAALHDKTGEVAMAPRKISNTERKEAASQGLYSWRNASSATEVSRL